MPVDVSFRLITEHQPANYKLFLIFLYEEKLFSLIIDLIKAILAAFINIQRWSKSLSPSSEKPFTDESYSSS